MFNLHRNNTVQDNLFSSELFDEKTFYQAFIRDLENCREEAVIESPYITIERMRLLKPIFERLINKGVDVFIITRYPNEHDGTMAEQAEAGIQYFEVLGAQVLLCAGNHHRKLAMIDREILWEGSLNILSQAHSREFMRKIKSKKLTEEMFKFLNFDKVKFFRKMR